MIPDLYKRLRAIEVSPEFSEKDLMRPGLGPGADKFYFDAGRGAIRMILTALVARLGYAGGVAELEDIHDFGCGYGRVTRWLKAEFPKAHIWTSDMDEGAQQWCRDHLGSTIPRDVYAKEAFDLVYLGSVFTHLKASVSEALLRQLIPSLKPMGVLLFTSQGRWSYEDIKRDPERTNYRTKLLTSARLTELADQFEREGYAYQDYSSQHDYGISLIDQRWFASRIGQSPDVTQIMMQEKAWGSHQDAYAYLKLPIAERRLGHM
ncbi:MAG: hypothetical protein NTAFB05_25570 [Nitrobacter sp.]|uniref:class I SAM-dependent methyltransferase n=1 Tax=Nitrobacter sp. TaxID=29420 RepID=UPI00387DDEA2